MTRFVLAVLGLAVACSACSLTEQRPTVTDPPAVLPTLPIHGAYIHPRLMPMLDKALATGKEAIWQVTDIDWEPVTNSGFVGDSLAIVTGLVPCAMWGRVDGYTIEHFHCADDSAPTVHIHPSEKDCSPSRADFATQLARHHRFDLTYCAPQSGGYAYWSDRNPLLVERLLVAEHRGAP